MADNPTFGIVTFRRPDKLRRLVDSIRRFYQDARIVIADNGRQLPARPATLSVAIAYCETHVLPFDCGLSESRNFLVSKTSGDLLILDDDFEFLPETRIESFQEILDADPTVGIVCGDAACSAPMDFEDGQLVPAKAAFQITPGGISYQPCDLADNFMLIRRQVFDDGIRWNPTLKVGEHREFFETIHNESSWKVAHCPSVKVKHNRGGDDHDYQRHRSRGPELHRRAQDKTEPPSIVLLGVGHSGTRVFVRILEALGWNLGVVKDGVAENLDVQLINKALLARRGICPCGGVGVASDDALACDDRCGQVTQFRKVGPSEFNVALANIPAPWVIKDPRLVLTWDDWLPAFSKYKPLVLLVERDLARMRKTYSKYKFHDFRIYGRDVADLVRIARSHYATYDGPKLKIRYEQLADAVRCFDLSRAS
jgi:hypothetical protein